MFVAATDGGLSILSSHLTCRTHRLHNLREPEVQNLGMPTFGNKDVGGLDVPVDDAFCVGCVKSVRNLDGKRKDQFGFHRTTSNAVLQRESVQKFHGK